MPLPDPGDFRVSLGEEETKRIQRQITATVEEQHLAPACLIYLTDLCCQSYPEPPEYPVLWVTDSRRTAPFGETLRIADEA